jgi:acyl transferase domain-containing protein/aryl carrier-like protein
LSRAPEQIDYQSLLKEGYLQLQALQAKLAAIERSRNEPIAIVGMGCRFPGGAENPERFWQRLRDGFDAIREVTPDRWDVDAHYDPDPATPGKMYARHAGLLDRVDAFDAGFFGISPRECESMDPQQRLLLEVAWEALEDAGLPRERLSEGQTGTYVGVMFHDYSQLIASAGLEHVDTYFGTGNGIAFLSGRLSYHLGLRGPSLVIDTACSSSLVAVHLACQSLRSGESDVALACGVNLILSPLSTLIMCKLRALAPDGRCKTFDASADGYVRGEGCGVVVLKRLSDAMAQGDRIWAVIRGSAVNQDGASAGLTVPNGLAQQAVIRRALSNAGVEARQVGYVEAHGTGTRLGDPLEVRSLWAVLREGRGADAPLAVGSLKTNVGHMEGAAGVGALIKTVLALRNGQIPPHLHFKTLNPLIAEERIPIHVPTELTPWPAIDGRRSAGVSSFGLSGTNAHVIIEEAATPAPVAAEAAQPPHLLCLSARSEAALKELARRYRDHLAAHAEQAFADVCFMANTARSHFEHRLAIVAADGADCGRKLEQWLEGGTPPGVICGQPNAAASPAVSGPASLQTRERAAELERIGPLYVRGGAVDLSGLDRTGPRRKVSLPTYPFQRQRYWIDVRPAARSSAVSGDDDADGALECLYETQWRIAEPAPAAGGGLTEGGDRRDPAGPAAVLVFAGAQRGPDDLALQLASQVSRAKVFFARRTGSNGRRDDGAVDLSNSSQLAAVLGGACARGSDPLAVLYVRESQGDHVSPSSAEFTCAGLLRLVQSLAKLSGPRSIRLWVITRGAQAVCDENVTQPGSSVLWGLGKVISLEYPELWGGLIDLPGAASAEDVACVLQAMQAIDDEDQTAYRGGRRYVPRLERCRRPLPSGTMQFRADACYWIAGGLGALGLQLARWIVERGARHVILQGRTGLPDRHLWPGLPPDDGEVFRRVSAVRELEALGATVEIVAADVADPEFVGRAREHLRHSGRRLAGVFHVAGLSGVRPLAEMTADELESVLRAKVQGAWNLHELTREMGLDFFVCFSSIASVWGSRGLGHYAAANAFLDAFAHYRRGGGLPALTVNWGPLEGGGMRLDEERERLRRVGIKVLARREVTRILGGLMRSDLAQVTVADVDWGVFKPIYQAQRRRPFLDRLAGGTTRGASELADDRGSIRERLLAAAPDRRQQVSEAYLLEQIALALKSATTALDTEQSLTALGVDSLMAMELQARIRAQTGVDVPIARFLDARNIAHLAGHLVQGLRGEAGPSAEEDVVLPASGDMVEGEI